MGLNILAGIALFFLMVGFCFLWLEYRATGRLAEKIEDAANRASDHIDEVEAR